MFVISGVTGRVGSVAAQHLLAEGHPVRVLVRTSTAARQWADRGADVAVVDLTDTRGLADALAGATGFFTLLPFDLGAADLDAHADAVIAAVATAVAGSDVAHVVMLSSAGADLPEGTGPITGLHRLEEALRSAAPTLTALRSGHFQEKVGDLVDVARAEGIYPVFAASADTPIRMVATRDLGRIVADALISPPASSEAVDVLGPRYTERQVADVLAQQLGKPLEVVLVPEAEWADALTNSGFAPHVAASLAEMYAADEAGMLEPRGDRSVAAMTELAETVARVVRG